MSSQPPPPPAIERRIMPRKHHAAGFVILLLLLLVSVSNPFRVRRTVKAEGPRCRVEVSYPARMVFAETEYIEARVDGSRCDAPTLELSAPYLQSFRSPTVLAPAELLPSPDARSGERAYRMRMDLTAARSMGAAGHASVRCGEERCASVPLSTFVFP